jgi:FtsZ-binding cell division protein ZapB
MEIGKTNIKDKVMKQNVIEFFQNLPVEKHEQFNEAFKLYRDSPNKNSVVERTLNARGYSEGALENLLYDLQKMHDITDVEKVPVPVISLQTSDDVNDIDVVNTEKVEDINVKTLVEENENLTSENEDLQDEKIELIEENNHLKEENQALKSTPKIDNQSIRVEFPFLNNADCPDEFKILIADKITAWNRYLELQEQIEDAHSGKTALTEKELAKLGGEAINCFDENQKIYNELNAYQTTGLVLGVHPIFKRLQLTRDVDSMTNDELIKYKSSSAKYFSVNKTALAKAKQEKDTDKILEIDTRLAERHDKLFLVNKKLGV